MLFNNLMHVSFYTNRLEAMEDFYINKLGGELKIVTRAKAYLDRPQSGYHALALADPEKVIIVYIELAPGLFVELFPKNEGQGPAPRMGENLGYAHFALTVDDIFAAREELERRGVVFDTEISKGPSETYQMWAHDPDGNAFEIMQYTSRSFQVVGHIM